jgi:tRNA (adenine37-N6)-methyltransferase
MADGGIRPGEVAVTAPTPTDAGLTFIGLIRTPWRSRAECPRQGALDGPACRLEVAEPWIAALEGVEAYPTLEVLYWLHEARRDLVRQSPAADAPTRGTFSIRSPVRPNPIGSAIVRLVGREGAVLTVHGLDCLDGTPLLDIKPDRSVFKPLAAPRGG